MDHRYTAPDELPRGKGGEGDTPTESLPSAVSDQAATSSTHPSTPPPATAATEMKVSDADVEALRSRVTAFYRHYNPSKIGDVDTILAAFRNNPQKLIPQLIEKYGPEPGEHVPLPAVVAAPSAAPVSAALPTVPSGPQDLRSRILNFFDYYRPDKLLELDKKLQKHKGREEQWLSSLVLKYGPEPPPRKVPLPAVSQQRLNKSILANRMELAARLTRYYKHYNPAMVPMVDEIIAPLRRQRRGNHARGHRQIRAGASRGAHSNAGYRGGGNGRSDPECHPCLQFSSLTVAPLTKSSKGLCATR